MPTNNEYLVYRNSFYWDKHQYAAAGCKPNGNCNYYGAEITHFNHDAANGNLEWDSVESYKEPLENRVWRAYSGQPSPIYSDTYDEPIDIGRVLDNGETQLEEFTYNDFGNLSGYMDPAGRVTTLTYAANEIDILSATQSDTAGAHQQTVATFTYDTEHDTPSRRKSETDALITSYKTPSSTSDAVYNKVNELTELAGKPYSYDADSNELSDGARKYSWDAESRLVGISYAGSKMTTRFAYDGLDRRVAITTTDGNKTTTEHYIWCARRSADRAQVRRRSTGSITTRADTCRRQRRPTITDPISRARYATSTPRARNSRPS